MKLDFLDDLTDNGRFPHTDPERLLRLYEFDSAEARRLKERIETKLISRGEELDLSGLDFIQPINCSLTFQLSAHNFGIRFSSNDKHFVCKLTLKSYKEMCDIIQGFIGDGNLNGYNWLYDPGEGKVDLLFSPRGTW